MRVVEARVFMAVGGCLCVRFSFASAASVMTKAGKHVLVRK